MSELEKKTEEAPKRKRRTKAEFEEAKKNGTYKPRKKVVKEEVTNETKAPEEHAAKAPMKPEQSVLIMACLNPTVAEAATKAAHDAGVKVVILEDRVIHDYLEVREGEKPQDLSDFLNNASNRLHAEDQCKKLYAIITKGGRIEDSVGRVFTASEVVKATNLTHSKARAVFDLLRAFGLIKFTKGNFQFMFTFSNDLRRKTIKEEVLGMLKVINVDIQRYRASIYNDDSLTPEQKHEMYNGLAKDLDEVLEF